MSMLEPENTRIDNPTVDSGVHIRDTHDAQATLWQMLITGLLVIAILCVFFYGVSSQREETTGPPQQQASTSVPPAQSQPKAPVASGQTAKPTTTGQGTK
jgi:hypothetical protein